MGFKIEEAARLGDCQKGLWQGATPWRTSIVSAEVELELLGARTFGRKFCCCEFHGCLVRKARLNQLKHQQRGIWDKIAGPVPHPEGKEDEGLMADPTESEEILQTAKRTFLIRPPAERLLLSIIDANPGTKTDVNGASWRKKREIRLKTAMEALSGLRVSAKGQQQMSDQKALSWMASERDRDRFFEQARSGNHPFFPPGSASYESYIEKMGDFKFRSDRTLADQAAERYFGPFTKSAVYDLKRSHSERLRRKWRDQRGFWNWNELCNDYVDESIESQKLTRCLDMLIELGITTVPNDLAGSPVKKRPSNAGDSKRRSASGA